MNNNSTVETAIGAAVILIAAIFFVYAYQTSGKAEGAGGYSVTAEFDNAAGVNTGTDIRLAGIKIGTVTGQVLNPENYQAVITMAIDPKISLSDDTTAKITSEGLLGSNFIAIEPGGSDTRLTEGGRIAYTQGAVDIWSLISQAMFDSKSKSEETSTEGGTPPAAEEKAPPEGEPATETAPQ
jgi:phospholipid/cholesterol/gamma-HCH transport system substrate-binding protein